MYLVSAKYSQLLDESSEMDLQPRQGLFEFPFEFKRCYFSLIERF